MTIYFRVILFIVKVHLILEKYFLISGQFLIFKNALDKSISINIINHFNVMQQY